MEPRRPVARQALRGSAEDDSERRTPESNALRNFREDLGYGACRVVNARLPSGGPRRHSLFERALVLLSGTYRRAGRSCIAFQSRDSNGAVALCEGFYRPIRTAMIPAFTLVLVLICFPFRCS